jgi:predicted nucleic acid-binding protein
VKGWLLDTNVLSELRKPKPKPNAAVVDFVGAQPGALLYVSDVAFGEIRYGIQQVPDATRRAELQAWLDGVLRPLFSGRVLPISEDVILRWKMMVVEGQKRGHTFGQPDLFIAATAAVAGLVVVSRDVTHFVAAGTPAFDPWTSRLHWRNKALVVDPPSSQKAVAALLAKARRD